MPYTPKDVDVVSRLQWIPIENLHVRFLPFLDSERDFNGRLENSREFELFSIFHQFGYNMTLLKESEYVKQYLKVRELRGYEPFLKFHLDKRWAMYRSVKAKGFKPVMRKKFPVKILAEPFWKTRFCRESDNVVGPEIWDGAAICACLMVLGKNEVKGLYVKDAYPGKMSCSKLDFFFRLNRERNV